MSSLTTFNDNKILNQNLIFAVGKNNYALPILHVVEIIELPYIEIPQNKNSFIVGLFNFNNMLINIIDIRFLINESPVQYSIANKIILVKTDETIFGIIADKIDDISDVSNINIQNIMGVSDKNIIKRVYTYNQKTVYLLNVYELEKFIKNNDTLSSNDVTNLLPTDEKSIEILKKRSINLYERFNSLPLSNFFTENKFISFLLDGVTYCLKLEYAKAFLSDLNITQIPCSPGYIEGFMPVKGDFYTILNLKKFFNCSNTEFSKKSKVIIVNLDEYKLGLLVDDIYEILNIPEDQIKPAEINLNNECLSHEYLDDNTIKPILNMEKLIRDKRLYIDET